MALSFGVSGIRIQSTPFIKTVHRVYSLNDWTWPLLCWAACLVSVFLDTQAEFHFHNGNTSSSISVGPFGGWTFTVVLIVTIVRFIRKRRAKKVFFKAIQGQTQFVTFDESGFCFGFEKVYEQRFQWSGVDSIHWGKNAFKIRVSTICVKVFLAPFSEEEKNRLIAGFRQLGLVVNPSKMQSGTETGKRKTDLTE